METRSCAALRAADLGLSSQDAFRGRTLACGWSGTPWLIFAPSLWACGPRRPPSPRRLGRPQVEAPHQDPWRKWAQPLTSIAKAELDQICWTTLLKDFCNNTSVFLQEHFSISATSFCIFATRSIYTEAQRHSFDPKNVTWRTWDPNRPPLVQMRKCSRGDPTDHHDTEWESAHFSLLTWGHNWPFRCLDLMTFDDNNS